ncbi:hypothetical protein A0H81_08568 [Grifola frondosa]|uniref:Uncharacterized protein n=1 Tax=Grifola frondosa TaxID=5627 RepID=A0A1C7M5C0_GRIFR|nr:hypothetical protein A0H81_08568 [Grifola frondosa]
MIVNSFFDRQGTQQFHPPHPLRGYLAQINEWARGTIQWHVTRIGGEDHIPIFQAYPVWGNELLDRFTAIGPSKKAAMEEAARLMALSGHC